jgi:hypothetical protein
MSSRLCCSSYGTVDDATEGLCFAGGFWLDPNRYDKKPPPPDAVAPPLDAVVSVSALLLGNAVDVGGAPPLGNAVDVGSVALDDADDPSAPDVVYEIPCLGLPSPSIPRSAADAAAPVPLTIPEAVVRTPAPIVDPTLLAPAKIPEAAVRTP